MWKNINLNQSVLYINNQNINPNTSGKCCLFQARKWYTTMKRLNYAVIWQGQKTKQSIGTLFWGWFWRQNNLVWVLRRMLYAIDSLFFQEMWLIFFSLLNFVSSNQLWCIFRIFVSLTTSSSPQKCTVLLEILGSYSSQTVLSRHIRIFLVIWIMLPRAKVLRGMSSEVK